MPTQPEAGLPSLPTSLMFRLWRSSSLSSATDVRVTGRPVAASVAITWPACRPAEAVRGSPVTGTAAVPPAGTVTSVAPSVNGPSASVSARFSVTSAEPVLVRFSSFVTATSPGSCGHV